MNNSLKTLQSSTPSTDEIAAAQPILQGASVQISSDPQGADIEIDKKFVGSTPSQTKLVAGEHTIKISKKGFTPWERTMSVENGDTKSISAELDKAAQ